MKKEKIYYLFGFIPLWKIVNIEPELEKVDYYGSKITEPVDPAEEDTKLIDEVYKTVLKQFDASIMGKVPDTLDEFMSGVNNIGGENK